MPLLRFSTRQLLITVALVAVFLGISRSLWRAAKPVDNVNNMCISPDGKFLAAHYLSGLTQVWRIDSKRPVLVHRTHGEPWYSRTRWLEDGMCFRDETHLLWVEEGVVSQSYPYGWGAQTIVHELDLTSGKVVPTMKLDIDFDRLRRIRAVQNYVVFDGEVFDLKTSKLCHSMSNNGPKFSIVASWDRSVVVTSVESEKSPIGNLDITVWDAKTWQPQRTLTPPVMFPEPHLCAASSDASQIAVANLTAKQLGETRKGNSIFWPYRCTVSIFAAGGADPNRGEELVTSFGLDEPSHEEESSVHWVEMSSDGKRLGVGGVNNVPEKGAVEFYDVATKALIRRLPNPEIKNALCGRQRINYDAKIPNIALSPNGALFLAYIGGRILAWDIDTGKLRFEIREP